jgi:hypothetical protein
MHYRFAASGCEVYARRLNMQYWPPRSRRRAHMLVGIVATSVNNPRTWLELLQIIEPLCMQLLQAHSVVTVGNGTVFRDNAASYGGGIGEDCNQSRYWVL